MLKRFLLFLRSLFTPRRPTPPPRRPTPVAGQLRIVQAVAAMPARAGLMPRISYQAALRTLARLKARSLTATERRRLRNARKAERHAV